MEFNFSFVTKAGLGIFLGLSMGVLLRYFLLKILLIVSIPVATLFILDFTGFYKVNWTMLNNLWNINIMPPVVNMYDYLNQHVLWGIVPGIIVGFGLGFLITKKFI